MLIPTGPINNIKALVQIMAWCQPGDAIIWTNDDYFTDSYMRHSASMSLRINNTFIQSINISKYVNPIEWDTDSTLI